ncbi:MAG: transglutaminase-like domain-containing protein [Desulfobacterales bacterium]|jgi:transglutaminase-like putative cysteine protease|nr:transglutaminase-like domain-containing protein [Desulfobacterales bacterium]
MNIESTAYAYLAPTAIIDSDHPSVQAHARAVAGADGSRDPVAAAVRLYYDVRDGIWYDPYLPFYKSEHFRASTVLAKGRAFCIGKAGLLCALGRAIGIPSRLGFADVRNHLTTPQFLEYLGSDVFVFHGYTEFLLDGRWVKATPAFNAELCRRHRVAPLEFNGRDDSIFQSFNEDRCQFMEYVADHGVFADIPHERILTAMQATYGEARVRQWIDAFEQAGEMPARRFRTCAPILS